MTNEPQSESAQEVDISQSAPARAWADTWRFLTSAWFVLSDAALATSVAALSYFGFGLPGVAVAFAAILSIIAAMVIVFTFAIVRAPIYQRNEVRKELADIREQLRPKLRVVDARNPFDTDENLSNALIYIEYLRLKVANQSDSVATNCRTSLVDIRPKNRYVPATVAETTYITPDAFAAYTEIPVPISLTWSDNDGDSSATYRSIPPRGEAQVDVMRYRASDDSYPAFSPNLTIKQRFELPETEVVFSIRLESDDCLPYFYTVRYLPNAVALGPIEPLQILHEGSEIPNLEDFRKDVPVLPTQGD